MRSARPSRPSCPHSRPAMLRARFHLWESGATARWSTRWPASAAATASCSRRQDEPEVAEAVDRWSMPACPWSPMPPTCPPARGARYVGIDNTVPGVTAAYLIDQWLGEATSDVLITLSRTVFRGEGEREVGFRAGCAVRDGHRRGQRQRRHRRHQRAPGARRARAAPDDRGRLFGWRRQHGDGRGVRDDRRELPGVRGARPRRRQPAAAPRRPDLGRCCTTICAPTRGWRCG